MVCEHLEKLEDALLKADIVITYRGQAWSANCREWVYFDCVLDIPRIREEFVLPDCVVEHEHKGTHDGQELGLFCTACKDGIMGMHPQFKSDAQTFPKLL